jgi:ketosteroid isomerase-like protein
VEIVRRIFTTINDGFDLPRELHDSDYELDLSDQAGGVHHGVDAALEQMRPYWETFEDFRYEIEEVIYADDMHVIVAVRDGGRLSRSDAEVWTRFYDVFTFRNAKVVRTSAHLDRNRARVASPCLVLVSVSSRASRRCRHTGSLRRRSPGTAG